MDSKTEKKQRKVTANFVGQIEVDSRNEDHFSDDVPSVFSRYVQSSLKPLWAKL